MIELAELSGSHCLQSILNKILKMNILFMIIFICPITFELLKMGGGGGCVLH